MVQVLPVLLRNWSIPAWLFCNSFWLPFKYRSYYITASVQFLHQSCPGSCGCIFFIKRLISFCAVTTICLKKTFHILFTETDLLSIVYGQYLCLLTTSSPTARFLAIVQHVAYRSPVNHIREIDSHTRVIKMFDPSKFQRFIKKKKTNLSFPNHLHFYF